MILKIDTVYDSVITVESGEVTVLPINIEANTQAEPGTCYCTLLVDAGGDSEKIELTVDVGV